MLFIDSSGRSGEQPLPGTRRGGTHLGKFSGDDDGVCYPSHLELTFSFELLWFVSPPSHPKHSPLCSRSPFLPGWSSPAFQQLSGVTQTCATKTVGWVRTLSDLQSSLNGHSLKWNMCNKLQIYSAKVLTWERLSRAEHVWDTPRSSCHFSGCHCVQIKLDQIKLLQSSFWNFTFFFLLADWLPLELWFLCSQMLS